MHKSTLNPKMNVTDFYKYIENPEELNASTVAELQEVLKSYPYFQTAHFLYLKSLYNQKNFKFNDQLKFSSVHINNRKKLLFFLKNKPIKIADIESENLNQSNPPAINIEIPEKKRPFEEIEPVEKEKDAEQKIIETIEQLAVDEKVEVKKPEAEAIEIEKNEVAKEDFNGELEEKEDVADFKEIELEGSRVEADQPIESLVETVEDETDTSPIEFDEDTQQTEEQELKQEISEATEIKEGASPDPKNLSPQAIILKRIAEINQKKKRESGSFQVSETIEKERKRTLPEEKEIKPKQAIKGVEENLEEAAEEKEEARPLVQIEPKEQEEAESEDIFTEINELIQVAPPIEYFSSVKDDLEISSKIKHKVKPEPQPNPSQEALVEKHSFAEWLNHLSKVKKAPVDKIEKPIVKEKHQIIETFLSDKSSKIVRPKKETEMGSSKPNIIDTKTTELGYMTETLAKIYITQGYFEKAIEAYIKLSLKYPEKNSYFASQIEKVKKLQLNS